MVSLSALTTVAGGLGIGVGIMTLLLRKEREHFASKNVFVKQAVKMMKDQPTVMNLLGHSYKVGTATFMDGWGQMDGNSFRLRVPVKGDDDEAQLFLYARKKDPSDKFTMHRVEMAFKKIEGKKLILLDLDDDNLQKPSDEKQPSQKDKDDAHEKNT